MKRIRLFAAAFVLCLFLACALPVSAKAATVVDSGMLGDFAEWTLTDDGTLTLFGPKQIAPYYLNLLREEHENDIVHLVIDLEDEDLPDFMRDLTYGLPNLVSVTFSDRYTSLGGCFFYECTKLESVTLPKNLTSIPDAVFSKCTSLKTITLPSGGALEEIGSYAFCESGITSITIPGSVQKIGAYAFSECQELTSIDLQEGVGYLDARIFQESKKLKGPVVVPSTVKVGWDAFMGSYIESLVIKTVHLDNSFSIGSSDMLKTLTVDAPYIPEQAFRGCINLSSLTLSSQVKSIGSWAFEGCTSLAEVRFPDGITTIKGGAFSGTAIKELILPDSVTEFGGASKCPNLEKVVLPESVTEIGGFAQCPKLTDINLGHVQIIGEEAFDGCASLETVDLSSATSVGYYAFKDCSSLSEIIWPEQTAEFDHSVFHNCDSLVSVVWPATIPELDSVTFLYCDNLERLTISEGVKNVSISAVVWCSSFKTLIDLNVDTEYDIAPEEAPRDMTIFGWDPSIAKLVAERDGFRFVPLHDAAHTYDYGTITVQPNCARTGTYTFACQDCDITYDFEIPTTGHNYTEVTHVQDATPTQVRITRYTCPGCGNSYDETALCRIYGDNRYATGFSVADALKVQLGVESFDTIIVACGTDFADALTGSYLASVKNAPILLVNKHFIDEVAAYIHANLSDGGRVYLLGGTNAVPADMEGALDGLNVTRLAGANRYETNLKILEEAGIGDEEILICYGRGFADSLSASAVGKPILMVNKALNDAQKEFLSATSGEFIIIGGESAVSSALESALQEYGTTERIGGANRYETSILVAERFFQTPEHAILAYGANFPDGLCGGPLAYAIGSPLILTRDANAKIAADYTAKKGITTGAVLGGPTLISEDTAVKILAG